METMGERLRRAAKLLKREVAWREGICVKCQKRATWSTEAGEREYRISGMCEPCFDGLFAEENNG